MSDPDLLTLIVLAIGVPALVALAALVVGEAMNKVAFIFLGFAIVILLHLSSWQRGTGCLIGRAPLREPPPPGKTCLIAYPNGGYVYSR